ncbi:hypothetical protein KJ603_00980 [Patescibacteria group bacterium]|nr:hypothetical protein [Patescibacteria group bacterium]
MTTIEINKPPTLFNAFEKEIIKNIIEGDKVLGNITYIGNVVKLMIFGKTLEGDFEINLSTPGERLRIYGIPQDPQFKRIKKLATEIMGRKHDDEFTASTKGDRYYRWLD